MSEKIVVPVLGESITEATVSKWLKNEGDSVDADEPIVELETDKVNLEVPSPVSGVLSEINFKDGTVVEVGALLGSVSENGSGVVKKKDTKKIDPSPQKNNIVNLEVSQKEPKVFDKKLDEDNSNDESQYIDPADLPQVILDYIISNYPDETIIEAEIDSDGNYEVSLSNGYELYFDKDGNFIRLDD